MRLARLLVAWSCMFTVPACTGKTEADTRFEENKSLFAEIARADQLTLFEGLPHPTEEAKLFAEEKGKATRTIHGELFYREPLAVSNEDADKLHALLGNDNSFQQWRGEKKCGAFHADYCAEWRSANVTYQVHICFGCDELKVFGGAKSLRCDFQNNTEDQLKALLKKYRKNRPAGDEE